MYRIFTEMLCMLRSCIVGLLPEKAAFPLGVTPALKRKIIMRVNVVSILLLIAILPVSATSLAQPTITFTKKGATLEQVFQAIKKQTGYHVLYSANKLDDSKRIDVNFIDADLKEVLDKCLEGQPLTWRINEGTITLVSRPVQADGMTSRKIQFKVTGTVTDTVGIPLSGVSVTIKNIPSIGVATDSNGRYSLEVPEDAVLVFTFMGFESQEIRADGRTIVNVVLEVEQTLLDDLVVVAYGTQKKTSLTSAVSTMKGEEVTSIPVANLSNAIGGRIAGVIVKQRTGEPGRDGSDIYIRGISTTGSTQPLLIVDGIPRSFQQLDPNSIDSYTVLKDAAAVAPYGVAGANGVILVTTKRGKSGTPSLSYNGYVGFQNPTVLPKYVNGYQFALLKNAAAANEGLTPRYTDEEIQKFKDGSDPDRYPNEDVWRILANRNTPLTSHNIELSGGSENFGYYTSLGYMYQAGMWGATHQRRYNLTVNLDAQVTKSTHIGLNINGRVQNANYPSTGDLYGLGPSSRLFELIGYSHAGFGPQFFTNGKPASFAAAAIFDKDGYQKINSGSLYSQLSVVQKINFIEGLSLKGVIAYDPYLSTNKLWAAPISIWSIDATQTPYVFTEGILGLSKATLNQSVSLGHQLTYQAGLDYNRSFGKSSLGVISVFEAKANYDQSTGAMRRNYNLTVDEINMGSSNQADQSNSGISGYGRQVGFLYRVTYDYDSRYLLEASGRYDGSYFFAPGKRFGFFPAFSVGWRISEEHFLKDRLRGITNLKLRASYGEVGALAGRAFQYLNSYSILSASSALAGSAMQGARAISEPNPDITWERAQKTDVGLEVGVLNGLVNIEADLFFERRSNMLVNPDVVVPAEYGIGLSQVNDGVMENRGFDLMVGFSHRVSDDLYLAFSGNLTYAKNKLIQVYESPVTYSNPNRRRTGRPLGTQFGFQSLGLFQLDDFDEAGNLNTGIARQPWGDVQPGDIRYKDMNNDGVINDDDLTRIGDPVAVPRVIYGMGQTIRYKSFSLDLLFQGVAKVNYYLYLNNMLFWNGMTAFEDNLDYWTPENTDAQHPRATSSPTTNNSQRSSFWIRDASYLRLKNAVLAYSLPASALEKLSIQSARVYLSGQNLLTWTQIDNYDPEVIQDQGWSYPQQRVISIGVSVTF